MLLKIYDDFIDQLIVNDRTYLAVHALSELEPVVKNQTGFEMVCSKAEELLQYKKPWWRPKTLVKKKAKELRDKLYYETSQFSEERMDLKNKIQINRVDQMDDSITVRPSKKKIRKQANGFSL